MSTEFNGKKLLVIGGTSGMGLQTARMVLEQGGSVVIVGHREDKAEEARKALSSLGTVTALTADLSRAEDVKRLLHTIDEHHKDINLLVNAAGVFFPKAFLEHTESDYEQYLTLNKAFFFITQKSRGQSRGQRASRRHCEHRLDVGQAGDCGYAVVRVFDGKSRFCIR